jgi:hypothetical protein
VRTAAQGMVLALELPRRVRRVSIAPARNDNVDISPP